MVGSHRSGGKSMASISKKTGTNISIRKKGAAKKSINLFDLSGIQNVFSSRCSAASSDPVVLSMACLQRAKRSALHKPASVDPEEQSAVGSSHTWRRFQIKD